MEPKTKLDDYVLSDEHTDEYEFTTADTITLSSSLYSNTVIGGGYLSPGYGAVPTVTVGAGATYSNISNATITGGPYTISGGTGITQPWFSNSVAPKIKLDGEGADIEVNGVSLMDMLGKIEERLNILHPNEKLEAEWEELRALGEQYRKLEQHIKDKQATWDRLKAMPAPEVD